MRWRMPTECLRGPRGFAVPRPPEPCPPWSPAGRPGREPRAASSAPLRFQPRTWLPPRGRWVANVGGKGKGHTRGGGRKIDEHEIARVKTRRACPGSMRGNPTARIKTLQVLFLSGQILRSGQLVDDKEFEQWFSEKGPPKSSKGTWRAATPCLLVRFKTPESCVIVGENSFEQKS